MTTTRMFVASTALALVMATGAGAQTTAPGAAPAANPSPTATAPAASTATQAAPAAGTTASTTGGTIAQGATVYDTQGGTVGTIESLDGEYAVLATAKSKVRLPKTSFAAGAKGPLIAMTATQLDQAAAQAAPAATAAATTAKPDVTKGSAVADTQGGAVGTVAEVDAQFATVQLTTGGKVRLPVNAFAAGPDGKLRVAMTAAQLSAAAGASSGSAPGGSAAD